MTRQTVNLCTVMLALTLDSEMNCSLKQQVNRKRSEGSQLPVREAENTHAHTQTHSVFLCVCVLLSALCLMLH